MWWCFLCRQTTNLQQNIPHLKLRKEFDSARKVKWVNSVRKVKWYCFLMEEIFTRIYFQRYNLQKLLPQEIISLPQNKSSQKKQNNLSNTSATNILIKKSTPRKLILTRFFDSLQHFFTAIKNFVLSFTNSSNYFQY